MAKDIYHNVVKTALEKDGWTITNDPLTLKVGGRSTLDHYTWQFHKAYFRISFRRNYHN